MIEKISKIDELNYISSFSWPGASLFGSVIFNDSAAGEVLDPQLKEEKSRNTNQNNNIKSNQTISASAAGIRALVYQLQALYLRTPVKLFRPSRFDYMAYVRELANKKDNLGAKPYKFRTHSSIGMLVNAVRKEGWRFIPDQVLPPLVANSATGLILYTTYLTAVETIGRNSYYDIWKAGFIAGVAQSLAAAPVDAIYTRLSAAEILNRNYKNLWTYGLSKLKEVGLVGVFAGYGFSLVKESIGFAFYFSTFELVKTQGYNLTYRIISSYRNVRDRLNSKLAAIFGESPRPKIDKNMLKLAETKSTKVLKSSFVLLAGASAAFTLISIQYPLNRIQNVHLSRLEALDIFNSSRKASRPFIKLYYNSYIETYHDIVRLKRKSKLTWFRFAYKGFATNALTAMPATSVGLLVFEIMRTKLSDSLEMDDRLQV